MHTNAGIVHALEFPSFPHYPPAIGASSASSRPTFHTGQVQFTQLTITGVMVRLKPSETPHGMMVNDVVWMVYAAQSNRKSAIDLTVKSLVNDG